MMGSLIKNYGASLIFQFFQNGFSLLLSGGKKASNTNLLVDNPDKVSAVMQAAGPGREVTSIPAS